MDMVLRAWSNVCDDRRRGLSRGASAPSPADLMNAAINRGIRRRSAPSDGWPLPTIRSPRRIAKKLKAVVRMLNAIEAAML